MDIQYEKENVYHKMSPGNAYKGVTRWFSPSNSYIQIDNFKQPVACGKDFQLDIIYSTPKDTDYNFYVMVSFHSNLVLFIIYRRKQRGIVTKFDYYLYLNFHRYEYRKHICFICFTSITLEC